MCFSYRVRQNFKTALGKSRFRKALELTILLHANIDSCAKISRREPGIHYDQSET